ncbi:MAG: TetR/AcrR family transcriptional regulator [Nitratireductor sp.]|nr:TetR/AcrR family transcriptional regulator [Nitratireductor sp.]
MSEMTPRRQRKIEKRRQEILSAAKQLFLSRSYLQVTVDEIADAAAISKATVYSHFDNKLEIYSAIILGDAEMLVDSLREAADSSASLQDNLQAMSKAYVHFFSTHPEYFEKLSWFYFPGRERHLSRAQIQAVGEKLEAARDVIATCLNEAIENGEIKKVDVRVAALTIYSQWLGLVYLTTAVGPARRKRTFDFDKAIEFACSMQFQGLAK